MLPTYKERLGSVIRALSVVVAPAMPNGETLALEQLQLAIHHLQVIHDQHDDQRAMADDEAKDALGLALSLLSARNDARPTPAEHALKRAIDSVDQRAGPEDIRRVISATCDVIEEAYRDTSSNHSAIVAGIVTRHEVRRSNKDRKIFSVFGFDN